MPITDNFFSSKSKMYNVIHKEYEETESYIKYFEAMSKVNHQSIHIIDYQKNKIEYISKNSPLLVGKCIDERKELEMFFYYQDVIPKDLELLKNIVFIKNEFYKKLDAEDIKKHAISYDFHIKNPNNTSQLLNQKQIPFLLTETGKIRKELSIVSLSNQKNAGNIKLHKNTSIILTYDLHKTIWIKAEQIKLSDREKEILRLSRRGFSIHEIAEQASLSPHTVKFHRKKIFEKIGVSNITEAILYLTNNDILI